MNDLIDASFAFLNCDSLESIILPNQMKSLESTNNMFQNCINLTYINLEFLKGASDWKSSISMFEGCISLNEIIFPFKYVDELKNTSRMFFGCSNLKSLNLEKLNTGSIICLDYMFSGCINLIYLNIYNLDTSENPDCYHIFEGVSKNIIIKYDRFKTGVNFQQEIDKLYFEYFE